MPKHSIPKNIKPAGYGKTTLAFLMDSIFTFIVMYILYSTLGNLVVAPALHRGDYQKELSSFIVDSSLADENGTTWNYEATSTDSKGVVTYGYKQYEEAVWNYYTVFLLSNENASYLDSDDITKPVTYEIAGDYVLTKVYSLTKQDDGTYRAIGEAINVQPYYYGTYVDGKYNVVVNDSYADLSSHASELLSFYSRAQTTSSRQGAYVDCLTHIRKQNYYVSHVNALDNIRYLTTIPSVVIAPLIFFFILPLAIPNGRTLGKLIVGTVVLGSDGYKAKKINIAVHYFVIVAFYQTLLLPSMALGIMAYLLVFLIDYVVLILNKNHQALHDLISQTIVINGRESTWFASKEEEDEYIKSHPSSYVSSLREEKEETSSDGRKLVVDESAVAAMDSILDLSTIDKNRREAREMTSFDEFEKSKEEEFASLVKGEEEAKTSEQDLLDAAALDGLTKEEMEALAKENEEEVEENGDFTDKKEE